MPTYPTSPLVRLAEQLFSAVAPAQSRYFAARVSAWQGAPTASAGATAVLGTLGTRLSPGSVATQVYPKGVRNYQLYPAGITVH
ncbi:MAG: hypothetical protein WAV54_13310 [Acidimicrobiales bacterium]